MLTHTVLSRYYVIRFAQVHERMNERCFSFLTRIGTRRQTGYVCSRLLDPFHLQEWDGLHKNVLTIWNLVSLGQHDQSLTKLTYIETIESRGGEVVFVKFPTSRFLKDWEDRRFRDKYWDIIIEETGCRGFHYLDNTNTRDLFPPDGSHLLPLQAKVFTRELVKFVYPED